MVGRCLVNFKLSLRPIIKINFINKLEIRKFEMELILEFNKEEKSYKKIIDLVKVS